MVRVAFGIVWIVGDGQGVTLRNMGNGNGSHDQAG